MAEVCQPPRPALASRGLDGTIRSLRRLLDVTPDPAERGLAIAALLGDVRRRTHPLRFEREAADRPELFDAVLFCGEWELLDFRVRSLHGVTAKTLVVEADRTFAGTPREWLLTPAEIARRGWTERVEVLHVVLPDDVDDPDIAAAVQRNYLADLIARHARPSDMVLLSDLDELPSAAALREPVGGPTAMALLQTLFFANHERIRGPARVHGAAVVPASELARRTPSEIRRAAAGPLARGWSCRRDAGRHLQYAAPGQPLPAYLRGLGRSEETIAALLADRERVSAGEPLDGYACLSPDDDFPGGAAPVIRARLADALEIAIAAADLRSGRRRVRLPGSPVRGAGGGTWQEVQGGG